MLDWIKFYFFGFFFNSKSKEARKRSFWNVILTLFLFIIILPAFYTLSYTATFGYHIKNATTFNQELFKTFYNDDNILDLKTYEFINGDDSYTYAKITKKSEDENYYLNTFKNPTSDDYKFIIDTRDIDLIFLDFTINAIKGDDVISYDDYCKLSNDNKKLYKLDYQLTDNEIDVNLLIPDIDSYFMAKDEDDKLRTDYEIIKNEKDSYESNDLYNHDVYSYYLWNLYPEIFTDSLGGFDSDNLPNLSNYYYNNIISKTTENGDLVNSNFAIFTNSYMFVDFTTDKNINVYYMGYYNLLGDNYKLLYNDQVTDKIYADSLSYIINNGFVGSSSVYSIQRFLAVISTVPTLLIFMAIVAFLLWLLNKLTHQIYGQKFLGCFKIVSSFLFIDVILVSLSTFVTSFFLDAARMMNLSFALILLILVIRTIIMIIHEFILFKKDPLHDEEIITNKVSLDPIHNYGPSGTRVIVNSDDDNDEKETMEMM